MLIAIKRLCRNLGQWFILPGCSICGQFSPGFLVCLECTKKLEGERLEFSDDSGFCNVPALGTVPVFSLYRTSSFSKKVMHQIKYSGKIRLMASLFGNCGIIPRFSGWTILPVPLHPSRKRERGFNQAKLLADLIAFHCGGVVCDDWLCRKTATTSQTNKDKGDRFLNMNSVFCLTERGREALIGFRGKILLVDDVITTGATLGACVQAIMTYSKNTGSKRPISFFTLLKTDIAGKESDFFLESMKW